MLPIKGSLGGPGGKLFGFLVDRKTIQTKNEARKIVDAKRTNIFIRKPFFSSVIWIEIAVKKCHIRFAYCSLNSSVLDGYLQKLTVY